MIDYNSKIKQIVNFQSKSLTERLNHLESNYIDISKDSIIKNNANNSIDLSLLNAAFTIKEVTSKLYIIIHSVGILLSLPHILWKNEKILSLSLGAGNSGKDYDLETNKRIAEFKFITWQNKSNTIRQNSIFKDFYQLAERKTKKKKYLYVLDKNKVVSFFNSDRSVKSVLSRNIKLHKEFIIIYSNKYETVSDYYNDKKKSVIIIDLNKKIPNLLKSISVIR